MRGIVLGSLGLIALQALLSGKTSENAAGLIGWAGTAVDRFMSPAVPAITNEPGLRKAKKEAEAKRQAALQGNGGVLVNYTPPKALTGLTALI